MAKKILIISLILLGLTQISFGQKSVSPAKKLIADQLAWQTVDMFPIQYFEDGFRQTIESKFSEMKNEIVTDLTARLEKSELSEQQRTGIKAQLPEFSEKMILKLTNLWCQGFNPRVWVNKSLQKNYSRVFTLNELQKLNLFFKKETGKNFVNTFNRTVSTRLRGENADAVSAENEALFFELAKAIGLNTFTKFTDILVKNTMDEVIKSADVWSQEALKNMEKPDTKEEFQREINDFIAKFITE